MLARSLAALVRAGVLGMLGALSNEQLTAADKQQPNMPKRMIAASRRRAKRLPETRWISSARRWCD
jgi:hypothetical protein